MLDDFRDQADDGDLFDEESLEFEGFDEFSEEDEDPDSPVEPAPKRPKRRGPFLGMTPAQRLLISILLVVLPGLLSASCLILTGNVVPL